MFPLPYAAKTPPSLCASAAIPLQTDAFSSRCCRCGAGLGQKCIFRLSNRGDIVQVPPRLTAAIPMDNPYCSCKLNTCSGDVVQLGQWDPNDPKHHELRAALLA